MSVSRASMVLASSLPAATVFVPYASQRDVKLSARKLVLSATSTSRAATFAAPVPNATLVKRPSHPSDLASELVASSDVSSALEPWLPKLTTEEWHTLLYDTGTSDWNVSWQLFSAFLAHVRQGPFAAQEEPVKHASEAEILKACNCIFRVLCKFHRHGEVELLQKNMQTAHIKPDGVFYNTLLEWYASQGLFPKVSATLQKMEEEDVKRDPYIYEKVAFAYLREESVAVDQPKRIMEELMQQGAPVSMGLFKNLVKEYWRKNDLESVEEIVRAMRRAGHTPDLKISYKLMQLHGQKGNHNRVRRLIQQMSKSGRKPTPLMYTYLVQAYCRAGLVNKAKDVVLSYKTVFGCKPPLIAYNMLIDGYAKCGNHEEAVQVLSDMRADRLTPDPVSYSSIISGLVKDDKIEQAEAIFCDMLQLNLNPNLHTYQLLIRGYTKRNLTRAGHEVHMMMRRLQVEMTSEAYSVVLILYLEGNWYYQAAAILKVLANNCIPLTAFAKASLIHSFGIFGTIPNPLSRAVHESRLEICKLLTSVFITNNSRIHCERVVAVLKKWNEGEDVKFQTLMYIAFMECFWRRGLKEMTKQLLYQGRQGPLASTEPEFSGKEWSLDVRGLSIGGGKVALVDWLLIVSEKLQNSDVVEGITLTLTVGDEFSVDVHDNHSLKAALILMLEDLGFPFTVSQDDPKKLQANGLDVSKWVLQKSLEEAWKH